MELALASQEYGNTVHWEEELQGQYRTMFLHLVKIQLDSLVQQKMLEPEANKAITKSYETLLKINGAQSQKLSLGGN